MDAQEGKLPDEEVAFLRLIKSLAGKQVAMPEDEGRKVIRSGARELSIIEVTEELMRQLKK